MCFSLPLRNVLSFYVAENLIFKTRELNTELLNPKVFHFFPTVLMCLQNYVSLYNNFLRSVNYCHIAIALLKTWNIDDVNI